MGVILTTYPSPGKKRCSSWAFPKTKVSQRKRRHEFWSITRPCVQGFFWFEATNFYKTWTLHFGVLAFHSFRTWSVCWTFKKVGLPHVTSQLGPWGFSNTYSQEKRAMYQYSCFDCSLKRWDRWYIANWMMICYRSHLLTEPGVTTLRFRGIYKSKTHLKLSSETWSHELASGFEMLARILGGVKKNEVSYPIFKKDDFS